MRSRRLTFVPAVFGSEDRKHNIVLLFFELEDELDPGDFVQDAEIDCGSGGQEIHGFAGIASPGTNVSKIKPGFLLLNQNPHIFIPFFPVSRTPKQISRLAAANKMNTLA